MKQNINDTRIIIYDLTGNNQVLNSYDNEDTFQQDNKFVDKSILSNNDTEKKDVGKILLNDNNNNKISTIDDVIDLLKSKSDFIDEQTTISNINSNNSLYQKSQYIVYGAKEKFKTYEFFIKCDDRCYLKFKLPLIFDVKNKILYQSNNQPNTRQETFAGFSIPKKNKFCLSMYQGYPPMPDNSLYTFGCDYRWGDQVNRMCYVNHNTYNFEKYQYLVNCDGCKDFQPLPLDYFDNIYDGFKNKGISTLPKTLFGCSSYDNVKGNVCCLGLRCDAPMPKPFTMSWENISARFNLNGINGEQKALNSQNK